MKYLVQHEDKGYFWDGSQWGYWQDAMQFTTRQQAERIAAGEGDIVELPETLEEKESFTRTVSIEALDHIISDIIDSDNMDFWRYEVALLHLREDK